MTPNDILKEATDADLKAVVVVGVDQSGRFFVRSQPDNVMAAYFLLGRGMHEIQNLSTSDAEDEQKAA